MHFFSALLALALAAGSLAQVVFDLEGLPFPREGTCLQVSSTDRTGGNDDGFSGRYSFLYLTPEGHRVIFDEEGPGVVTRIWSANPTDAPIKFYFDGEQTPRISCNFAGLFRERCGPFIQPLAGLSSGGAYSYVPIPFARHLKIVVEGDVFFLQIQWTKLPAGARVVSYDPGREQFLARLEREARLWAEEGGVLPVAWEPRVERVVLGPGETGRIRIEGPAVVRRFSVDLPRLGKMLRRIVLRVFYDGQTTPAVEAPLPDFFLLGRPPEELFDRKGLGFKTAGFRWSGVLEGTEALGTAECFLPMPVRREATLALENTGTEDVALTVRLGVDERPPAAGSRYLHAQYYEETTQRGRPYTILRTEGSGHYVGCMMSMQGTGGLGFLEGDERVFVDGEGEPSIVGTGTEDFFNCGWYFNAGPVALPFHGVLVKDERASRIVAYRLQFTDAVPFERSLLFTIEHGPVNNVPGCRYSSVAYWYADSPTHERWGEFPLRPAYARAPHDAPPDAIDLPEDAAVRCFGDATASPRSWDELTEDYTRGGHLLVEGEPGSGATLKVDVGAGDRYELILAVTRGPDYGSAVVLVDGEALGPVDCAAPSFEISVPVTLGEAHLEAGQHEIGVELLDSPGGLHRVGLDYLLLRPASPMCTAYKVVGPFPNIDGAGFDVAYPPEEDASRERFFFGQRSYEWREAEAPGGVLDLVPLFTPNENVVAYAKTCVLSGRARPAVFYVGSDDGVKVWVNGELVHSNRVRRALKPDQDRFDVNLREGANEVLFKIEQGGGAWALSFRVNDPHGDLRYSTSLE